MTSASERVDKCDKCGRTFSLTELDGKPSEADLVKYGSLVDAADAGCQFIRLECRECYGPDYSDM